QGWRPGQDGAPCVHRESLSRGAEIPSHEVGRGKVMAHGVLFFNLVSVMSPPHGGDERKSNEHEEYTHALPENRPARKKKRTLKHVLRQKENAWNDEDGKGGDLYKRRKDSANTREDNQAFPPSVRVQRSGREVSHAKAEG